MSFEKVEFTADFIGPHLMESITKGLYVNPLHTIREYVQNEIEAEPPASTIKISIGSNEISIWGNGGGMNKDIIYNRALKIGFSSKDPTKNYGFRGIGLWSGIAVCDTVIISTKRKNEEKEWILKIDAVKIREEIKLKEKPLITVLSESVDLAEIDAPKEKFGTLVRLVNILEESKAHLLDEELVKRYLSLSLPVDFSDNFPHKEAVNLRLQENVPFYKHINVYFNDEQIFKAPYYDKLEEPRYMLLKDDDDNLMAYLWFCMHDQTKLIPDTLSRNIIYKKFGYTVGNRNSHINWWKSTKNLAPWSVGEIHIIDTDILPNSERMDFESSDSKDALIKKLENVNKDIIKICRQKSFFANMYERIEDALIIPKEPVFDTIQSGINYVTKTKDYLKKLRKDGRSKYMRFSNTEQKTKLESTISRLETSLEFSSPKLEELEERFRAATVGVQVIQSIDLTTPEMDVEQEEQDTTSATDIIILGKEEDYFSITDLLTSIDLSEEIKLLIQCIDDAIEEYYEEDNMQANEIKKIISDKIIEYLEE